MSLPQSDYPYSAFPLLSNPQQPSQMDLYSSAERRIHHSGSDRATLHMYRATWTFEHNRQADTFLCKYSSVTEPLYSSVTEPLYIIP